MSQLSHTRRSLAVLLASTLILIGVTTGATPASASTNVLELPGTTGAWQGFDVAIAPNGLFALATTSSLGKVYKIDTTNMTVTGSFDLAGNRFVQISPDSSFALITTGAGAVHKLDTSSLTASAGFTALTGIEIGGLDIASDGSFGVVTDQRGNVYKFDTTTGSISENIGGMGYRNFGIAISSDRTFAYVAVEGTGVKKVVLDGGGDGPVTTVATGFSGYEIDFAPDGSFAYVSGNDGVRRIDASTDTASTSFTTAGKGISIAPDGTYAYLGGDAKVRKIDTATDTVTATIDFPSGTYPYYLDIAPNSSYAYAAEHLYADIYRIPMPPAAPTITDVSAGSSTASVTFTPGSDGGEAITNYEYSLNGGTTWTPRSPAAITSPLTITGLTAGQSYSISLRAVNSVGGGTPSNASTVTLPAPPASASPSMPQPAPSPSPTPSVSATPSDEDVPAAVSLPAPVAVGEGLVVVDGRIAKVDVKATEQRTWKITGEDFTLEFIPKVSVADLQGSFTAKAGTDVDVAGDGFVPGSLVATYLPGALAASLGDARVDADGTFNVTATLPAILDAGQYVFQVNGLASATSVRSVNLGLQLLAADVQQETSTPKTVSRFVYFKPGAAVPTSKVAARLTRFIDAQATQPNRIVVAPTVNKGADPADKRLARKRAAAIRTQLLNGDEDMNVRALKKVRTVSDPKAANRVRVVLHLG